MASFFVNGQSPEDSVFALFITIKTFINDINKEVKNALHGLLADFSYHNENPAPFLLIVWISGTTHRS